MNPSNHPPQAPTSKRKHGSETQQQQIEPRLPRKGMKEMLVMLIVCIVSLRYRWPYVMIDNDVIRIFRSTASPSSPSINATIIDDDLDFGDKNDTKTTLTPISTKSIKTKRPSLRQTVKSPSEYDDGEDTEEDDDDGDEDGDQGQEEEEDMDIETRVFGNDLDARRRFWDLSGLQSELGHANASAGSGPTSSRENPGQRGVPVQDLSQCEKVEFLFPHVPKTGGRTIVFTFFDDNLGSVMGAFKDSMDETLSRSVNRSMKISTTRSHYDLPYIVTRKSRGVGNKRGLRKSPHPPHRGGGGDDEDYESENKSDDDDDSPASKCTRSDYFEENLIECFKESQENPCKKIIFFLREPISRLISAFFTSRGRGAHFKCENPGTKEYEIIMNPEGSLDDWAALPRKSRLENCKVFNIHTEFLVGKLERDSQIEDLMLARKYLLQMDWFGLTSRFEESMALISHTFNLNMVHYRPIFNYNPHPGKVSKETEAILTQGQELDVLLYRLAEKIFDLRWQALTGSKPARSDGQVFKCSERTVCRLTAEEEPWLFKDGPPEKDKDEEEYGESDERSVEKALCGPENGCNRQDPWV